MDPEEDRSDHHWGPRAGDSTMCKHLEGVDMVRLETAEEDIGGGQAGVSFVRPEGQ